MGDDTKRLTLSGRLTLPDGRHVTGPVVYGYRHGLGQAGQAVGPGHPKGPGYLEIHFALAPTDEWLGGDVTIDGVRRYLRPFHRSLIETGHELRLQVNGAEVVVTDPGPPDDWALLVTVSPDGNLMGERCRDGLLVGVGCYQTMSYPCDIPKLVGVVRDSGAEIYRTFTTLMRFGKMPPATLIHPESDGDRWTARAQDLVAGLVSVKCRPLVCLFDENTRSDRAPAPWNQRRFGPWWGEVPSLAVAQDLTQWYTSRIDQWRGSVLVELMNEPPGDERTWDFSWDGSIAAVLDHDGWFGPISVGTEAGKVRQYTGGARKILWEHAWAHWKDESNRVPRSVVPALVKHLGELRKANPGAHVGFSMDGARGAEAPEELARAVTGAGHSFEWMTPDHTPDFWTGDVRRDVDAVIRGARR